MKRQLGILLQMLEDKSLQEDILLFCNRLMPSIAEDDLNCYYSNNDSIFFDSFNLTGKNDPLRYDIDHVVGFAIKEIGYLLNDFGRSALITGNDLKTKRKLHFKAQRK